METTFASLNNQSFATNPATLADSRSRQTAEVFERIQDSGEEATDTEKTEKLRSWFNKAIGETFFGQMIKEMRKSLDTPAYFHGGRGEEVFQQQLDQIFAEHMTEATGDRVTQPMFDLFMLQNQK